MAVSIMTGAPGSGKSYSAVALTIKPALEMGRPIRTNIPLCMSEILSIWPDADARVVDFRDPDTWREVPGGALVVIDEVWDLWPSGQRADKAPKLHQEFVAMHRHKAGVVGNQTLSMEIVLLSQGTADVAKWVRSKIDKTYVARKLDAIGLTRRYSLDIYQGCEDTSRPRKGRLIRSLKGQYEPLIYSLYSSHSQSHDGAGVDVSELQADSGTSIWRSWRVVGGLVVGPIVAIVAAGNAIAFFSKGEKDSSHEDKPDVEAIRDRVLNRPAVEGEDHLTEKALSRRWRLVGVVQADNDGFSRAIISDGVNTRVLTDVECVQRLGEMFCVVDGEEVSFYSGKEAKGDKPVWLGLNGAD